MSAQAIDPARLRADLDGAARDGLLARNAAATVRPTPDAGADGVRAAGASLFGGRCSATRSPTDPSPEKQDPLRRWQPDVTHWHFADHSGAEILNIIDDHSRLAIAAIARPTITGPDLVDTFLTAFTTCATPAALHQLDRLIDGGPRR
ncbi:hypothetical protein MML61_12630 [Mycobacterium marinum]|uniref:hypothetical protein n=1 Tax=Mycobacterium marinum TaxID=1781 RepID=UPI00045FE68C|nr:hypothetical protein [Mycobacterium marinum]AXN49842.1 hypothetical protein CCUG20998_02437 [Mycobacterium marinum]RFZ14878.1 hypothetical protein DSM43519_05561 [Mycobacterium marinum]RFZ23446.1 hypothetical protein DSM44344_03117 [Mycobacterium marinum]RFZ32343.1 hypothetical protein NCTC2275_03206 [Mycobacterium marinum]RFZ47111.1 hypothetical protein MSS2_05306 [Mycobacterium marinum]